MKIKEQIKINHGTIPKTENRYHKTRQNPGTGILYLMASLDYITLSQAEELSGIKADTLKKRCQTGKITGAMKQGKTWFIPKEVILKREPKANDVPLQSLITLAEVGISFNITIFANGLVINGNLISSKSYYEKFIEKVKKKVSDHPLKDKIDNIIDPLLLQNTTSVDDLPENVNNALHLDQVKMMRGESFQNLGQNIIRLKLSCINGFYIG